MSWPFFLGGVFLIVFVFVDVFTTTLATHGAGPLTARLTRLAWRLALALHRRLPGHGHRLLSVMGVALLLLALVLWLALLWLGWGLVFLADPDAVVTATTRLPADLTSRAYFVGYALLTLGMGDYVPQGGLWQLLTAVASFTGLFLVTLSITYFLPVVQAAVEKRRLAATIHHLGTAPGVLVRQAWDGQGFEGLGTYLADLAQAISLHTERHLAYPILHYFHSNTLHTALEPALATLDEALLLLAHGVAPQARPAPAVVEPPRRAITHFLETLGHGFIQPAEEAPPPPPLTALQAAGVPVVAMEVFAAAMGLEAPRRCLLRGYVEDGGWRWPAVGEAS